MSLKLPYTIFLELSSLFEYVLRSASQQKPIQHLIAVSSNTLLSGEALVLYLHQKVAQLRSHNGKGLEDEDMHNDEDHTRQDEEDLDEELDETAASLPVERAPRIQEADNASAAENLGDNLSTKRTIEGDDGVLILRKNRSLDADERNHGREAKEECARNGE